MNDGREPAAQCPHRALSVDTVLEIAILTYMTVNLLSMKFDIIVVGGGGTGLMAAYSAACAGAKVLLVEKSQELGGTTGLSVGTICATSTRLQKEAGISDNPDSHFVDMEKFMGERKDRDNPALRRVLVDEVPETIRLLEELGVTFMGPLPEPPHSQPRLHAVLPHSRSFIRHLARACRRKNVTLLTGATVDDLFVEGGRVQGITLAKALEGRAREPIRARLGVILATGDFSSSALDYKRRFMSGPLLEIGGINPSSTGDGQCMGERHGGEVVNGDLAWGPEMRFIAPPRPSLVSRMPTRRPIAKALLKAMKTLPEWLLRPILLRFVTTFLAPSHALFEQGAVLVNNAGQRFCDELRRPQDSIGRQPDQIAFIILDNAVARRFGSWPNFISTAPGVGYAYLPDYARSRPDVYASAATLAELAAKIGVPADALTRSIAQHNGALAPGGTRGVIAEGPFHALGPVKSWIVFSEGGLRIDTSFRVLDNKGDPIAGLYAAGSAGQGGVLLEGHGHHLAWAFTSGRLAGQIAAEATVLG